MGVGLVTGLSWTAAGVAAVLLSASCGASDPTVAAPGIPSTTVAPTTTIAPSTTVAPTMTIAPSTTVLPATTLAPSTTLVPATTLAASTTLVPATTLAAESLLGEGGLTADLEDWAQVELPQFITASHIDVADLEYVSRFRSSAGHDFSDSFESSSSMKHYFHPLDFYEVRFSQPIYSPVDGVIMYLVPPSGPGADEWRIDYERETGRTAPQDYRDWDMFIRPDDAPNVWIHHMHVNPIDDIVKAVPPADDVQMMLGVAKPAVPGYRVAAGDLIAHGLGEIIIARHLDGSGVPSPCNSAATRAEWSGLPGCIDSRRFHSIFEFMTDEVFADYQAMASVTRDDFIVSAEERLASPLAVDGESFRNPGNSGDPDVYVRLQGSSSGGEGLAEGTAPARPAVGLADFAAMAAGREILTEFDALDPEIPAPFVADDPFLVVISADGGPIGVFVDDGNGIRQVFGGSADGMIGSYETGVMDPGTIRISVEARADVFWRIVVVRSP